MSANKICLKRKESQRKGGNLPTNKPVLEEHIDEENTSMRSNKEKSFLERSSSLS